MVTTHNTVNKNPNRYEQLAVAAFLFITTLIATTIISSTLYGTIISNEQFLPVFTILTTYSVLLAGAAWIIDHKITTPALYGFTVIGFCLATYLMAPLTVGALNPHVTDCQHIIATQNITSLQTAHKAGVFCQDEATQPYQPVFSFG
jgi:hypothetical protein